MTPQATTSLAGSLRQATDTLGDLLLGLPASETRSAILEAFLAVESVAGSLDFQAWTARTDRLVRAIDEGLPAPEPALPDPDPALKALLDEEEAIARGKTPKIKLAPPLPKPRRGIGVKYVARDMTCPACGAKPGAPCVRVSTRGGGKAPIGSPLYNDNQHDKRIAQAKAMNQTTGLVTS